MNGDGDKKPGEKKPITKTEADAAAERVIVPGMLEREIVFKGRTIMLRPLPVSVSKRMREALLPMWKEVQGVMEDINITDSPDIVMKKLLGVEGAMLLDEKLARAFIGATAVLVQHYGFEWDAEKTEEELSLTEATVLVVTQLEVSGQEDFLLRPLRVITEALASLMGADSELYRSLRAIFPSQKPGA